jgi:hypothetical protein
MMKGNFGRCVSIARIKNINLLAGEHMPSSLAEYLCDSTQVAERGNYNDASG